MHPPAPPEKKVDKVLEGYLESVPLNFRNDFRDLFRRDNRKGQPKKKKLILAKYQLCCKHGIPFDLDGEVEKLVSKVRIKVSDLCV